MLMFEREPSTHARAIELKRFRENVRGSGSHATQTVLSDYSGFAVYQLWFDRKTYSSSSIETVKRRNPRPTLPANIQRKNGERKNAFSYNFFHPVFSWLVGIGRVITTFVGLSSICTCFPTQQTFKIQTPYSEYQLNITKSPA